MQLSSDSEFFFFICHINSCHSFYIHPLQDNSCEFERLNEELGELAVDGRKTKTITIENVKKDTMWMVESEEKLWRVSITDVDIEAKTVDVFLIDWGETILKVRLENLLSLSEASEFVKTLPALAVHCHLAYLNPELKHDEGVDLVMRSCFDQHIVHFAASVLIQEHSYGIVVYTADTTLNETICNLPLDPLIDAQKNEEIPEWDPMTEDFVSLTNNYRTNDDDLVIATDGYRNKENICHFFTNKGSCYKGNFCEDLHSLPRTGAVTTDVDNIIIETLDSHQYPQKGSRFLLEVSQIKSPSSFYISFPYGGKSVLELTESSRRNLPIDDEWTQLEKTMKNTYKESRKLMKNRLICVFIKTESNMITNTIFIDNTWNIIFFCYSTSFHLCFRKYFFDDFPSPGSLVAVKSEVGVFYLTDNSLAQKLNLKFIHTFVLGKMVEGIGSGRYL